MLSIILFMEKCSICLCSLNENSKKNNDRKIKTLTCGHKFHFSCFRDLIFHNNYFIKCPICRTVNTDINDIYDNPTDNILNLCPKINHMKCSHKINGRCCKRKPYLLNYGYCYQHHKDILKKNQHQLMYDFIKLVLCQRNSIFKKIYTFDIAKKLIIYKSNEINNLQDLLYYFYRYINIFNINYYDINKYNEMYEYYNLPKPPDNWINYCIKNNTLI